MGLVNSHLKSSQHSSLYGIIMGEFICDFLKYSLIDFMIIKITINLLKGMQYIMSRQKGEFLFCIYIISVF